MHYKKELQPRFREYYLDLTKGVSDLSTCKRARVGSIIVKDNRIISTGYNGSVRGASHCSDKGCLMVKGHCKRCIHAEVNAIAFSKESLSRATLFCTHLPCIDCFKLIAQVGITDIVYETEYGEQDKEVQDFYREVKLVRGINFHKRNSDFY